jgi:NAD(P)-dependent dehydrogenase (short-subunit alcohol dehydrogenase family)
VLQSQLDIGVYHRARNYGGSVAADHALGRIGKGKEVAEAIQFLAQRNRLWGGGLEVDAGLGVGVSNN